MSRAALVHVRTLAERWGVSTTEAKIRLVSLGIAGAPLRGGTHYWTDDVAAALATEAAGESA